MHLIRLSIRGFRLFADRVDIDFPPQGVIGIRGFNTSTGSGSDSGKTSILEAIAMVFGYSSFSASDQESWLGDAKLQIDAVCQHDGHRYDFHVGHRVGVEIDGEPVVKAGSSTGYKRWLQEFFAVNDLDILKKLTFRPQRQGGLFLGMADAEKREFFSEVIGLQRFEALAEAAKQRVSDAEAEERNLKATLANLIEVPVPPALPIIPADLAVTKEQLEQRLNQEAMDFHEHKLPIIDVHAVRRIEEKQREIDLGESMTNQLEKTKLDVLKKSVTDRVAAEYVDRIAAVRADIERLTPRFEQAQQATEKQRASVQNFTKLIQTSEYKVQNEGRRLRDAQQAEDRLAAEHAQLQAKLCPTCVRPWEDDAYRRRLQTITDQLSAIRTDLQFIPGEIDKAVAAVDRERAELETAKGRLLAMEAALPKIAAERDSARARGHELRHAVDTDTLNGIEAMAGQIRAESAEARKACYARRDELQKELAVINNMRLERDAMARTFEAQQKAVWQEWESHRYALKVFDAAVYARQAFEKQKAGVEARLVAATQETRSWTDLQVAVKAFLGAIGEEILAEIAAEANGILAALPNTAEVTLRFATERITQKGGVRQEIRPLISKGGREGLNLKSQISGGQLTSVELATDPAVSLVLRGRRGAVPTPAWMAFDEAFDGHDVPIKEAFLEVLAGLASRGMQVFVIDHGSEFKESLQCRINVVCHDGRSSVVTDADFDVITKNGQS